MIRYRKLATSALAATLALTAAACAPQTSEQGGMSPGMQGESGTGRMQGHDMAGMDMRTMMNHCAQMRQQQAQGQRLSPDMQPMLAQCDQMDRQMGGMGTPSPAAMPDTTRSR